MGNRKLSRESIRKVRLRVTRIAKKLSVWGVRFIIVQHMKGFRSYKCSRAVTVGGAFAYTSTSTGVKLCPIFFSKLNAETRAMTIIHELVHTLGWGLHYKIPGGKRVAHGFDAFTQGITKDVSILAEKRPWRARRNPANYAALMRSLFNTCGPCS